MLVGVPDDVKPIGKLPAAKQVGILRLVLRFYQALNAEAEPFVTTEYIQQVRAVQAHCKEKMHPLLQGLHGSKSMAVYTETAWPCSGMVQMHSRTEADMQSLGMTQDDITLCGSHDPAI